MNRADVLVKHRILGIDLRPRSNAASASFARGRPYAIPSAFSASRVGSACAAFSSSFNASCPRPTSTKYVPSWISAPGVAPRSIATRSVSIAAGV
jgi:hypothetical protein